MKPKLLTYQKAVELNKVNSAVKLVSDIHLYVDELYDITYPEKKDSKSEQDLADYRLSIFGEKPDEWGIWVYYPWLNICYQVPPEKELRQLRTSRNRNLINSDEQRILYNSTIFIAGMSVGSNAVEALVSQGIGSKFILADMDIIEPTNLNRIRSPLHHVGLHKVEAIARKIWEIDPYIEILALNDGVNKENIETIFADNKIDIVIDEMDALDMKIALREKAKKEKTPVIMAADDGDDALLDIERYDLNPDMAIFNSAIPEEVIVKIKDGQLSRREIGQMIGRYFVGPENIPVRMYESLMEVGKTLPSWPQLGGAAALSGVALSYASKKILLKQKLKEGRTLISLDEKLSSLTDEETAKLAKYKNLMFGEANG